MSEGHFGALELEVKAILAFTATPAQTPVRGV